MSRDVGDLRRVQQLLVSSLEKLNKERQQVSLYGDAMATMESLAVLKAWAEVQLLGVLWMEGSLPRVSAVCSLSPQKMLRVTLIAETINGNTCIFRQWLSWQRVLRLYTQACQPLPVIYASSPWTAVCTELSVATISYTLL